MSNKEKLESLKAFLKANNVKFIENHKSKFGVTIDLKLPDLMIAVFVIDSKVREEEIFNLGSGKCKMRYFYKLFFIRESESQEFIYEKMQNCIVDRMILMQRRFEKSNKKNK